jgi:hypothetical protein
VEEFDDRRAAVDAFNEAWALIDLRERTEADDRALLAAAFASRYHWERVGGDEERAIGDWQIAHAASLMGLPDLALRFAVSALATVEANGWTDWRLASMYEGMARAHAAAGDAAERDRYAALAREVLATVEDAEDRDLIESQLSSIPA